jgi:hypothetical protein
MGAVRLAGHVGLYPEVGATAGEAFGFQSCLQRRFPNGSVDRKTEGRRDSITNYRAEKARIGVT